ncbi:helix-turn-helix domain-containing protein [Streptomyces sp. NPDC088253]|uniref:helix-turn-helix domain-containing protein n=1 Tax=Streptomyces sp. NPDC088253 TaxID=3365846 RepID=UPI0038021B29
MVDTDLLKTRAAAMGDVSHEEIAHRAGVNRSTVTRMFLGTVPTVPNLAALAWAYEISLDELVPKPRTEDEVPA